MGDGRQRCAARVVRLIACRARIGGSGHHARRRCRVSHHWVVGWLMRLAASVAQPLCQPGNLIIKTPAMMKMMNMHAPVIISQFIRACCNPPANG